MRLSNAEMEFCRELGRDAAAMVAAAWPQYANEITRVQDLCDLVARGILAGTRRKGEPLPIDGLQMLRSLLAEMVSRRAGSMLTVTWMNDELGVPITPTDTRNDLQQSRDAARQLLAVLDRSAFDAMKRFPGPIPATPCPPDGDQEVHAVFSAVRFDGARSLSEALQRFIAMAEFAELRHPEIPSARTNAKAAEIARRLRDFDAPMDAVCLAFEIITRRAIDKTQIKRYWESGDS